jgi:hypothetical protein
MGSLVLPCRGSVTAGLREQWWHSHAHIIFCSTHLLSTQQDGGPAEKLQPPVNSATSKPPYMSFPFFPQLEQITGRASCRYPQTHKILICVQTWVSFWSYWSFFNGHSQTTKLLSPWGCFSAVVIPGWWYLCWRAFAIASLLESLLESQACMKNNIQRLQAPLILGF